MGCTNEQKQAMIQNLRDAGCEERLIEEFIRLKEAGDCEAAMRLLACHRCHLVCQIHEAEKPLNCLDYFIYQMKKEQRNE